MLCSKRRAQRRATSHSTAPRRAATQGGRGLQTRPSNDLPGNLRATGKGDRNAGVQGGCARRPILVGPLVARYTDGMDTPEKRR